MLPNPVDPSFGHLWFDLLKTTALYPEQAEQLQELPLLIDNSTLALDHIHTYAPIVFSFLNNPKAEISEFLQL